MLLFLFYRVVFPDFFVSLENFNVGLMTDFEFNTLFLLIF